MLVSTASLLAFYANLRAPRQPVESSRVEASRPLVWRAMTCLACIAPAGDVDCVVLAVSDLADYVTRYFRTGITG
jgi:hypothetical protein